jgi:hypothetical protein
LLTAADLLVSFGVEQLAPNLAVVGDLSSDVSGGTVHRDMTQAVHGTVDLTVSRQLAWGYDRVRPYMLLTSRTAGVTAARFNLGVYLMTTPSAPLAESPISYAVTGFDQLHILQDTIGDSYAVAAGSSVLAAVETALLAAGVAAPILLDSSASGKTLATDMTWPVTSSSSPQWVTIVNDLLATVAYQPVWCDWDGNFRSGPYVDPSARASEWTFPVGHPTLGIVLADRSVTNDVWGAPNWWRFVQSGLSYQPAEGAGQYTVQNVSTGASSQASVGRVVHAPVQFLNATDQASLQAQGDAIVAAAKRSTEVVTVKLSPFPVAWHDDVVTYSDGALGADRKGNCTAWVLPLDWSSSATAMDYTMQTVG